MPVVRRSQLLVPTAFFLQVGNFRVEPPGLFRGRGEHPKMGRIKRRIYPRDITINIGEPAMRGAVGKISCFLAMRCSVVWRLSV